MGVDAIKMRTHTYSTRTSCI